jgi:4-amino-4-deoxy-L-arabinose transferase-like glycosyltransferase
MKSRHTTHLVALFAVAFLVRLIGLNQSLWLDEAITAQVIRHYSPLELISVFSPQDFHPPFYYLLLQAWSQIFGISEVALRLPSVLLSLAAGWLVYVSGKLLANKTAGWWSAALFLFNPLILYYSQEARMYSLVVCLVAINFYFLLRLLKTPRLSDYLFFALTIVLSLFTFYGVIFYLAAVGVYLVWQRQWRILAWTIGAGMFGLGAVWPLLAKQLANSQAMRELVPNWVNVLGTASVKNLTLIPLKLTSGRISFLPKWLYLGLAGIWTALVLLAATLASKKQAWLSLFLVVPIAVGVTFSIFTPLLQYFRFLYLGIFLALLLGLGLKERWSKAALLAGFTLWSLLTVAWPQQHREDWRSLATDVRATQLPVYMIQSSSDPMRYYAPESKVHDLRSLSAQPELYTPIVVIPYTADVHGLDSNALLQAVGYELKQETSVRGLSWQVWEQLP